MKLTEKLYDIRYQILFNKGVAEGKIQEFDDAFWQRLDNIYYFSLPASLYLKYLNPATLVADFNRDILSGECYERSLVMLLANPDAYYVRGKLKSLELHCGKNKAGHAWIELGDYVYDPTSLCKYNKDFYYKLSGASNIKKNKVEDYNDEALDWYNSNRNITIDDYMPNGKRRLELIASIPLIREVCKIQNNPEFTKEFNDYLEKIKYNEREIYQDLDNKIKGIDSKMMEKSMLKNKKIVNF